VKYTHEMHPSAIQRGPEKQAPTEL